MDPLTIEPTGAVKGLARYYDYRFGTITLVPFGPDDKPLGVFQLRVADLLREAKIPPHELRHLLKDSQEPEQPTEDIEVIRRRTVTETDLQGKTVLDVGGYGGEFAKLALDCGASRAIVLDNEQWRSYGWPEIRLEGVEYVQGDLMDYRLRPTCDDCLIDQRPDSPRHTLPRPDVILQYNTLYHVRNPLAFLERTREIIRPGGTMLLCTLFRYHLGKWVYFYEERACNPTDVSVFFGPSLDALEQWLVDTGWSFERTGLAFDRVCYRCVADREINWRNARY